MPQYGYLILAIGILLVLLAIFIVSFVLYKRTPIPKGCEDIKISEEKCGSCHNKDCAIYKERNDKE